MRPKVLDSERLAIFERLRAFRPLGALGGGTAIALQLGHRRSFDFDLLTPEPIPSTALSQFEKIFSTVTPILNTKAELTVSLGNIKCSLIHFPFPHRQSFVDGFALPLYSLADSAGNKAYALGRRGTYRDYVDLYALLQSGLTLQATVENAGNRFGDAFNERLFLQQLGYFGDISDFTIDWLWPPVSPKVVEQSLAKAVDAYLA